MNFYFYRKELITHKRDDEDGHRWKRSKPEITMDSVFPDTNGNTMIRNTPHTKKSRYDFYLAVAEEDLETFGLPFADMVEQRMGMHPCLGVRDILPGTALHNTIAETVENHCNGKVIFVLSENFADSVECQYLVNFAKTLDPDAKLQKLIPLIIDKNVKFPRALEGLTPINYNQAVKQNWLGKKLWEALHGDNSA